jgi:hypothetical protein
MKKDDKPKLAENVQNLVSRFQRIEAYNAQNVQNLYENWRYYWALNPHLGQGQWPASHVARMVQSGRQLTQYNFILPIIDSIAANMGRLPVEPEFIAMDHVAKELVTIVKHMMYSDRELMDWNVTVRRLILHGLIFEGNIKMVVSDYYHELGNIGFEVCPHGTVLYSPNWRSGRRKDLKQVLKKSWMSAEEIMVTYPKSFDRAYMEAMHNRQHGETYGSYLGINAHDTSGGTWGSYHQVIEEYVMKMVEHDVEFIVGPDGEEADMPNIPDEDKPMFLDTFYRGWDKNCVYTDKIKAEECVLNAAIPTLHGHDLVVKEEPTEVQVGSPPFFRWAAGMENGQCRGMVDSLKDPQTNYNFIAAEILRKIQVEGGGGSKFVDESLFVDTKEAQRFNKYSNRPDYNFRVKPGTMRKGLVPAVPVQTSGTPTGAYEHLNLLQNQIIPNVSKRPPITMGQIEGGQSGVSGRLFRLMGREADTQLETMISSYRETWNDIYEAHLLQAGQTYSNEVLPRDFSYKGNTVTVNQPVELPDGRVVLKNDMRSLLRLRYKILIGERQASPTEKANTANLLMEYGQRIPPELIGTRTVVIHETTKNLESLSEESQAELIEIGQLEKELAVSKLKLEKANVDMQRIQMEMQLEQVRSQMGQAPGGQAPGGQAPGGQAPGGQAPGPQGAQAPSQGLQPVPAQLQQAVMRPDMPREGQPALGPDMSVDRDYEEPRDEEV